MTSSHAAGLTKIARIRSGRSSIALTRAQSWARANVACPFCDAAAGADCVIPGTSTSVLRGVHVQRSKRAGRLAIEKLLESDGVLYHEDDAADAMAAKATPTVLRTTPREVIR